MKLLSGVLLAAALALGSPQLRAADDAAGQEIFARTCAVCHEHAAESGRIPPLASLRKLTSASIVHALDSGVMMSQGSSLTVAEKAAVARYLGSAASTAPVATGKACAPGAWEPSATQPSWTSWGGGPENRRFQENAGLDQASVSKLKVRWAFGFPDATTIRSQPAVYGGRLFVGGPDGKIYALDAASGCLHWTAKAKSQIRSGIAIANVNGRVLAVAGDAAGFLSAFDAGSGAAIWSTRLDQNQFAMVTSTPLILNDRIYVGVSSREEVEGSKPGYVCCTFRGSLVALNAADGKVIWKTWTTNAAPSRRGNNKAGVDVLGPSGAGIWATPTFDAERKLLYFVTGDNYSDPATDTSDALLAVAPADGRIVWSKQFTKGDAFNVGCFAREKSACPDSGGPDHDFGSSAILLKLANGKRALLLGQKSGVMHAVDPDRQGEILWEERVGKGGPLGGIQWGSASDGARVYVALSDFTDPEATGGLFALNVASGERVWQMPNKFCAGKAGCHPAQSGAVTAIPGVVFSGSLDGHLRAYNTSDGSIVWDYDADHEFQTVNGVAAKGGSFDGGGPVIAGGMVFAGSGYGAFGATAGNVLLAFGPE